MIKKILIFLGIIGLSVNLYSYNIKIAVTITPLADIVQHLIPDAEITTIIKKGQNPHLYSPTPADIKLFNKMDFFIKIGFGFENWFDKILNSIDNKRVVIIDLSKSISPIMYDKKTHTANPHYWMSPASVIKCLPLIKENVIKYFPHTRKTIEKNYKLYLKQLKKLDREIKKDLKKTSKRHLIESHPILDYFARDYGLHIAGIIKTKENTNPSPQRLIKLLNAIKKYNIKYILTAELDTKIAKNIAKESHINIMTIDTLGSKKNRESYINLIRYNKNRIMESLK